MLNLQIGGISCKISLLFPAVFLVLLMIDPSGLMSFGFFAAILHECGHGAALCIFGEKPQTLIISFYGMRMVMGESSRLSYLKQVCVALAGPFVNAGFAAALYIFGGDVRLIGMHLVLGAMNLLPVLPLDGGHALYWGLCALWKETTAKRVVDTIGWLVVLPLLSLGTGLWLYTGYNFTLFLTAVYVTASMLFYKGN